MIEVDGLTVRFGGVVPIDDMTLTLSGWHLRPDRPNGAGKTTFFNVLSGFVKPSPARCTRSATTCWPWPTTGAPAGGSAGPSRPSRRSRPLGVRQRAAGAREHPGGRATPRQDVLDAVAFVGLEPEADRRVGTLGAAQRRLVEVARAVVGARAWCCWTSRPPASPTTRPSISAG
jgi:ABC-type branched-subunit amino acid transport system ATPase component